MKQRIERIKKLMESDVAMKGCVALYPDRIKEMAVVAHKESKLSQAEFARQLNIAPQTLKKWIDYIGDVPHIRPGSKAPVPKIESRLTISFAETNESRLAKKRINNKARFEKTIIKSASEKVQILVPKEEVPDDIKTYIAKSIDKAIPIVNTKGDFIPQKFRDMQENWLKKNKPKRYSNGKLIDEWWVASICIRIINA